MIQPFDMDWEHGDKISVKSESLLGGAGTSGNSSGYFENFDFDGINGYEYSLHEDAIANEGNIFVKPTIAVGSSRSSSSLSSHSSIDLLQFNDSEVTSSMPRVASLSKLNSVAHSPAKDVESSAPCNSFSRSEENEHSSMASTITFQASDAALDSMSHFMSLTQSPPIQTMERSEQYDPFRIPSSVFERSKSTTPLEWSVASNESLFSIHLGNNSFSRERLLMFGKSGELTKSGELLMFSPSPPAPSVEVENNNCELEKDSGAKDVDDKITKDDETDCLEDPSLRPPPVVSSLPSNLSHRTTDGSVTSTRSFVFPVKRQKYEWKPTWTSCYCCNCSWAFRFARPRYYFQRCCWTFCYSWNFSLERCCLSQSIISEGLRTGSEKVDSEEQHLETPKPKPTAKYSSWFSWWCCSWRSPCCCCLWPSCHSCYSCRSC